MWIYRTMDASYLTQQNLLAWDNLLDQAEKSADLEYAFRVRLLRMGLDSTIVWKLNHNAPFRIERISKTLKELEQKRAVKVAWKHFHSWRENMKNRQSEKPLPAEISAEDHTFHHH